MVRWSWQKSLLLNCGSAVIPGRVHDLTCIVYLIIFIFMYRMLAVNKTRILRIKLHMQPLLVICTLPPDFLLSSKRKLWDNFPTAVHVLFMLFYVLNLEYPAEKKHPVDFFTLGQKVLFQFVGKLNAKLTSFVSALARLKYVLAAVHTVFLYCIPLNN
jgi:hypothetical protein